MERKKPVKDQYYKALPNDFLALCEQGLFLSEISKQVNISVKKLKEWSKSTHNSRAAYVSAFKRGRELSQAYHESLYRQMASGEVKATASQIDAQRKLLAIKFKEEWGDKQEQKIEISHIHNLTNEELNSRLRALANTPAGKEVLDVFLSSKPELKLVSNDD